MKQFETQRLILRPWRIEDLEDFNHYCQDPEVGPNAGWKPHESLEESRAILEDWLRPDQEDELWCIEEKESGKAVGSVGLHSDGRRSGVPGCKMLGYVLAHFCWGQGYMTEAVAPVIDYAFREEKLRLLTVNHFSFNQRSRRVIEKSGFQYEGTLRQGAVLYDGRAVDLCCYSPPGLGVPPGGGPKAGPLPAAPRGSAPGGSDRLRNHLAGEPQPRCRLPPGEALRPVAGEKITARTQPPQGLVALHPLLPGGQGGPCGRRPGPAPFPQPGPAGVWRPHRLRHVPPNTGDGAGRP